jgi:hypothetical protein
MKTNYYGESPCINAIWILLENLADRGLLIPRIQSTVLPNKQNQFYERTEEPSRISS